MKTVKVYKVESYEASYVGKDFIPIHSIYNDVLYHHHTVPDKVVVNEKRWPIKHYRWSNGKEIYAALPPELGDILEIEIDTDTQWQSKISRLNSLHKEELEKYSKATFLQRLKYLFTGKMEG